VCYLQAANLELPFSGKEAQVTFIQHNAAVIEPCPAWSHLGAVVAQHPEAWLGSPLVDGDIKLLEEVVDHRAVLGLGVKREAQAVVQDLAHGHPVESRVLLQGFLEGGLEFDENPLGAFRARSGGHFAPVQERHNSEKGQATRLT